LIGTSKSEFGSKDELVKDQLVTDQVIKDKVRRLELLAASTGRSHTAIE
jgi:hypothetical protein